MGRSVRLGGFLLRRLLASVPVAFGVATLVFFLVEWAPGSPVDRILGDRPVPPQVRLHIERAYGVDRSAISRYADWLEGLLLRADLGWSVSRSQPVSRLLAEAWPATVLLAGSALVVHFLTAVFLGAVSARYRGRWPDRVLSWVSSFLYAMPGFWLGLMAILLLSLHAGIFPPGSVRSVGAEVWPWPARAADVAWHTVLPAAVLGLGSAAATSRFVRASLLETLGEQLVQSARARGVGTPRLLFVHALRNGLLPVLQLAGLSLPGLVSGSLVVEVVFGWPGMGRLTYEAILAEDLPVVASATLLASMLVLLGSLLADLFSAIADPRVRIRTQPAFL